MKKTLTTALAIGLHVFVASASTGSDEKENKMKYQREAPIVRIEGAAQDTTKTIVEDFKPSINVGAIVHMFGSSQQGGFLSSTSTSSEWGTDFKLYRARVLVGGQLSKNGAFFFETEIPSIIGNNGDGTKGVFVSPIVLDCQYEHTYAPGHMLVAGQQLVSHNRNGLQGAASLMANDFTFFQYPYNLFGNASPLQGTFGRDLGVNARGFFLDDKLEYRLGVFSGRSFAGDGAPRIVGRAAYNFLDAEKDYYYAGTKIGNGKTAALAVGFDVQGTYVNYGADFFLDVPVSEGGSITLNTAFSYMDGGDDPTATASFAGLIPEQTTQFLELGYYFKGPKLQPWIRYEKQALVGDDDGLASPMVFGGGLNYWFNDYGTNLRLSYTTWNKKTYDAVEDEIVSTSSGQIWMQLQFFIF